MIDDFQIRGRIRSYILGEVSASELEDWLEVESWDNDAALLPVRQLAADVLRLLAEYGNGNWTEEELREQLGARSRFYWFAHATETLSSGAAGWVIHHDRRQAATGRSPAMEYA